MVTEKYQVEIVMLDSTSRGFKVSIELLHVFLALLKELQNFNIYGAQFQPKYSHFSLFSRHFWLPWQPSSIFFHQKLSITYSYTTATIHNNFCHHKIVFKIFASLMHLQLLGSALSYLRVLQYICFIISNLRKVSTIFPRLQRLWL